MAFSDEDYSYGLGQLFFESQMPVKKLRRHIRSGSDLSKWSRLKVVSRERLPPEMPCHCQEEKVLSLTTLKKLKLNLKLICAEMASHKKAQGYEDIFYPSLESTNLGQSVEDRKAGCKVVRRTKYPEKILLQQVYDVPPGVDVFHMVTKEEVYYAFSRRYCTCNDCE